MKPNLDVLNKLVTELNDSAEKLSFSPTTSDADRLELVVALSKCLGLVSAVYIESGALVKDFNKMISLNSAPLPDASGIGMLEDLFNLTGNPKKVNN